MKINYKYVGIYEEPKMQTDGSAGIDLVNNSESSFVILPNESVVIPTGMFIEIPKGYVGLLFVRSSLGFKQDLTLSNAVGVIDSDYRGEIKAKIINHSPLTRIIEKGERFCQLVIVPYLTPELVKVDELEKTKRNIGGMGSTGK